MNPLALLLAMFAAVAGALGGGKSSSSAEPRDDDDALGLDPLPDPSGSPGPVKPGPTPPAAPPPAAQEPASPAPAPAPVKPTPVPPPTDPTPTPVEPVPTPPSTNPAPTPVEPVPSPSPTPTPTPTPTPPPPPPGDPAPQPPPQSGDDSNDGAATNPLVNPTTVIGGRVATIAPQGGDDVLSVRILQHPNHGHLSVNPDNTLALVMTESNYTGALSFRYETTLVNGSTAPHTTSLNVTAGPQALGWATGDTQYMLETDEDGDLVIEHGDNHRKVYVTGSDDALSRSDIAAMAGIPQSQVTASWLAANPQYGSSPDMALDSEMARILWGQLSGPPGIRTSNWLLFERGYDYDNIGGLVGLGTNGESAMNPLFFGAWGEGERPVLSQGQYIFNQPVANVVFQGLHFTGGMTILDPASNIIIDDSAFSQYGLIVQNTPGVTIRNSDFTDIYRESPLNSGATWDAGLNRISAIYADSVDGLLLEGNFFDHTGWDDDYRFDASTAGGHPPSMFSHNVYIQYTNTDVAFRDNIVMRAASVGTQVRSGGYVEDNIFIDNNVAFNVAGYGEGDRAGAGHYSLVTDNVVVSAGHKTVAVGQGATAIGIDNIGFLTGMVDNIVTHMADPNNPAEIAAKTNVQLALNNVRSPYYDDTIVWNWQSGAPSLATARNVDGLDTSVLNQTTIQNFTAQLLGRPSATINDLADYLRAQGDGAFDDVVDADLIIRFFQVGFGVAPDIRLEADTLRFVPDDVGDGVRWDNRLNWDTDDLPGSVDGDSVDLGGNRVIFSGLTSDVNDLEFGDRGGLAVTSGRLNVLDDLTVSAGRASLQISNTGQFWTEGFDGPGVLDVDQTGGRFVNTGEFRGQVDMTLNGGQTILASDGATFALTAGSRLEIVGNAGRVGFDGDQGGLAILGLGDDSTLAFTAANGRLGTIGEFRSGAFGDAPDVQSGIDLGNAALQIDLRGISGSTHNFTLMQVDELIGALENASFIGLGSRNADIVIDYATDTVSLGLTAGTGAIGIRSLGTESMVSDGNEDLWAALTAGRGTWDDVAPVEEDEVDLDAAA